MSSIKLKNLKHSDQTQSNRRSFLWKAGAAMSAGLAAAVPGMARTNNDDHADRLARQVTRLKDEQAIRKLYSVYEQLLDDGRYRELADLFTDDAEVLYNGGSYRGKDRGINRLYNEHFRAGRTGKKMVPAPGFEIAKEFQQEVIDFAADAHTARARFPYSIQAGAPMPDASVLVQMARLHGEGIRQWWECGIYDIALKKDNKVGNWKITRLEHRVMARADYKPGRSQATPVAIARFDKIYPEEPTGPDALITRG